MEQYVDEYLRNIFGESLLEAGKKTGPTKVQQKPQQAQQKPPKMTPKVPKKDEDWFSKTKAGAEKHLTGLGTTITQKGGEAGRWVYKTAQKHPLAVGALALGAGALAYKRYLGAAARACAKYSGTAKTQCMQKYRMGALSAEALSLKENCLICLEDPNKELCLELVKLRIEQVRQEIKKSN